MACKGKCKRFYPDKKFVTRNWVKQGYIKCNTCNFHTKNPNKDVYCRCCGFKFRKSVRNHNNIKYYYNVVKPYKEQEKVLLKNLS